MKRDQKNQVFKKCPFCGCAVQIMTAEEKKEFDGQDGFNAKSTHFCCANDDCLLGSAGQFWEMNFESEEEAQASWNERSIEESYEKRNVDLEHGMFLILNILRSKDLPEITLSYAAEFVERALYPD